MFLRALNTSEEQWLDHDGETMNETIKTYVRSNPKYSIGIIIGVLLFVTVGIFLWTRTDSHIDTKPIQRADEELRHAGEYNRRAIEYNQRIGDTIKRSQDVNERITTNVNRSLEATTRAEESIDRSTELVKRTRESSITAKNLIRESRDILESAKRNNQESTTTDSQQ